MWLDAVDIGDGYNSSESVTIGLDANQRIWLLSYSHDDGDNHMASFCLLCQEGKKFKPVCSFFRYDLDEMEELKKMIEANEPGTIGEKEIQDSLDLHKMKRVY